MTVILL